MSGFVGFVLALELMVALMGLFLAVTPWLMKKTRMLYRNHSRICSMRCTPTGVSASLRRFYGWHNFSCLRSNGRNFSS